jgi:subtilisin family serine protease
MALAALSPQPGRAASPAAPRLLAPAAKPQWLTALRSGGSAKAAPEQGLYTYIVLFEDAPLASYRGGLAGLAAAPIGPSGRLDPSAPAARSYLSFLARRQASLLVRLQTALGRQLAPRRSYRYALNGISLVLRPAEAAAIAGMSGVRLVQRDQPRQLATDTGPALIGAAQNDLRPALLAADLDGAQAAPPQQTQARGRAVVSYSVATGRVGVSLSYSALSGAPSGAWLALAAPSQPGTVTMDLAPLAAPGGGMFAGDATLAATAGLSVAEIESALLSGGVVAVIATAAAPGGEIRGRLAPVRGEGMVAGVIDSGINALNPQFADLGGDGYDHSNPRGAGAYLGVCSTESGFSPPFPCNDKLIGAYTYPGTAGAPDPAGRPSPFDDNGHGSHTASTLGGNMVAATSVGGVATGPIAGVAPHASLIAYDVCGTPSGSYCPLDSIVAAIDQAVADRVDVINYSISGFASDPWGDVDSLAMLGALDAGIITSVAASNDGPTPASIGSPANAPWVMTVGASTHSRRFVRTLGEFSGGATEPPVSIVGVGFGDQSLSARPIVDASRLPARIGGDNGICLPFADSVALAGAIVVCQELVDTTSLVSYAKAAGAGGVVIVWPEKVGPQLFVSDQELPTVHVDAATGLKLLAWLAQGHGHQASLSAARRDMQGAADSVGWFSSRGPNSAAPDVLKPDLMAPGFNILASTSDHDPLAADYGFLSGTSMAAPHAAGAATLLRQLHPDWTASELRSALMSTATAALTMEDAITPASPHAVGAGRVRVDLAARAGLVLDERAEAFAHAHPGRGGDPAQLNLASLSSAACLEICVFTRTVRSALAAPSTWAAASAGDASLGLTVEPQRFTLAPGATLTLSITARIARGAFSPDGSYLFSAVTFVEERGLAPPARFPTALNAPSAILPHALELRTTAATGTYTLADLRTISSDKLTLRVLGPSRGEIVGLKIGPDPTPSDPLDREQGVAIQQIDVPAGTPRVYVGIAATTASDLDLFIFADGERGPADGVAQEEELICLSATYTSNERCDLSLDGGAARRLIVLVQNYVGSGAATDDVKLLVNVTPLEAAGNLTVSGPSAVGAGERFEVLLAWALPDQPGAGGRYMGALQLSSSPDPEHAGDLGVIPLDLLYLREQAHFPLVGR